MQAEIFEQDVAISPSDNSANGIIQSFHDAAGEAFVEVIQEFVPPVLECLCELYQLR